MTDNYEFKKLPSLSYYYNMNHQEQHHTDNEDDNNHHQGLQTFSSDGGNSTSEKKRQNTCCVATVILLSAFIVLVTLILSLTLYGSHSRFCLKCGGAELAIILTLSLVSMFLFIVIIVYTSLRYKLNSGSLGKKNNKKLITRRCLDITMIVVAVIATIIFIIFLAIYILFMVLVNLTIVPKSGTLKTSSIPKKLDLSYLTKGKNVIVEREDNGIIHIDAETEIDAVFAQGVVCAQERLFQIELMRRAAQGRLSELVGSVMLEEDKNARYIGYARMAKQDIKYLSPESLQLISAFVDGINTYINTPSIRALSIEYLLLGITPEEFTVHDILCIIKYTESILSFNKEDEERRYEWMEEYGISLSRIEELDPPTPLYAESVLSKSQLNIQTTDEQDQLLYEKQSKDNSGAFIPKHDSKKRKRSTIKKEEEEENDITNFKAIYEKAQKEIKVMKRKMIGSNNWAVHKNFTDTPSGYLANDPHLEPGSPNQFYLVHIKYRNSSTGEGNNLFGASLAGVPGIGIGRNAYISWSITLGFTDVQDFYMLKADPSKKDYYIVDGESLPFNVIYETIKVDGEDDVQLKIRESIFGPVIGDSDDYMPAYRWIAQLQNDTTIESFYNFVKCRSWDDFRKQVYGIKSLVFNYIFSDYKGNIGYILSGAIPIRKQGHTGRYMVDGSTRKYDYEGYVPDDKRPQIYNPPEGFVSSANNRVTPPGYEYLVSSDFFYDYRQKRIHEVLPQLVKRGNVNVQDMINLQLDSLSVVFEDYKFMFVNMTGILNDKVTKIKSNRPYLELHKQMLAWDGFMKFTSTEASLFENFLKYIAYLPLKEFNADSTFFSFYYIKNVMLKDSDKACTDRGLKSCTEWAADTFIKSVDNLYDKFGKIPTWATLHDYPMYHLAGKDTPIIGCLSQIVINTEGGTETVLLANVDGDFHTIEAPVYRQIINFNTKGNDKWILPSGNDGNMFSRTYDNMGSLFGKGEYLEMIENPVVKERFVIEVDA